MGCTVQNNNIISTNHRTVQSNMLCWWECVCVCLFKIFCLPFIFILFLFIMPNVNVNSFITELYFFFSLSFLSFLIDTFFSFYFSRFIFTKNCYFSVRFVIYSQLHAHWWVCFRFWDTRGYYTPWNLNQFDRNDLHIVQIHTQARKHLFKIKSNVCLWFFDRKTHTKQTNKQRIFFIYDLF